MKIKKEDILRGARYLINGGLGLLCGVGSYYIINKYSGIWYIYSLVIAFILTEIISFVIKKFWVFKNKDIKETKLQLFLHFVFAGIYLLALAFFTRILVERLLMQKEYAQALLVLVFLVPNYIVSKKIFPIPKTQQN
ncbi:MAG: GtrA family protein [Candidatus Paceibacterota bacterium]